MIKKLEITNVGRFQSAKTEGDEQFFKKNTFIYGKNTYGKSTLTAIFRSLKENNPDYLIGRKTIGSDKQVVKIIPETTTPIGEYRYTTDEAKWSNDFKNIVIFDNLFVRESVYTQSQQIGQEQQKNIETFMLGAKGAEYNIKIADLDQKIKQNSSTQTVTINEYNRSKHLFGNMNFDDFLLLSEIGNVDAEIIKEQAELDKIKNSELISGKLNSIKNLLERYKNFDITNISEKLSVNTDAITQHFDNHINQSESRQSYSSFLQTGAKLRTRTTDELCPFCTQELTGDYVKSFLNTIDLVYNDKYRKLQQAIKEIEALFPEDTFSAEIEKIKTDLKQAGYELTIDFTDIDTLIVPNKKAISDKKDDLSSNFDNIPLDNIWGIAENYVATIEAELINFQNPVTKKVEIENILKKLNANKERFGSWKERSEVYLKAKEDNKTMSEKRKKLWDEYLNYATSLSSNMLTDINAVLSSCSCAFTIQTFNFKGNQRSDLLVLSMNGSSISNDGDDNEMTIKNSLSDSDKWILALAFFLATVKNSADLKVIVMDDPVSSFDSDRKWRILKEIKNILSNTDKQLILLTHEKGFYHLLYAENKSDTTSTFLKLNLDNTTGSNIILCNPSEDHEFMDDFNCWISDMRKADISNDESFVKVTHEKIRKVIEHILKEKYSLELITENTVEAMLTKLEQSDGPYFTNSPRTKIENVLINITHHDQSRPSQYPVDQLGINDYKKAIKEAFGVIKEL